MRWLWELKKKILSDLIISGIFFKPNNLQIRLSEGLKSWEKTFDRMIEMENSPLMKLRWRGLKKIFLWLCTTDGAYKLRALVLLELLKNGQTDVMDKYLIKQFVKNKKQKS